MVQLIIYLLIGLIYSASSTLTVLINAIISMTHYNFEEHILEKYESGKGKVFLGICFFFSQKRQGKKD